MPATTTTTKKKMKKRNEESTPKPPPSSWEQFMNILTCKNPTSLSSKVHNPLPPPSSSSSNNNYVKPSSRCNSSICSFRDVVHVSTRIVDHTSSSNSSSDVPHTRNSRRKTTATSADDKNITRPSAKSTGGGMHLRKLSGCYECRAIDAEPASRRYPRPRTLCPCAECGEVFTKPESLELHQALRHAVSELGPEDSGRNIVEIIFKSSWQKDSPVVKIERILKVHNTQRTVARFEDCRESVKSRALLPRKNPRCAADGNELLRFHCTSLFCPLGANSSTSLCLSPSSSSHCNVCTIIRYGFARVPSTDARGIGTNASSGRAHDWGPKGDREGARRAMVVCRVIAGRVRKGTGPPGDDQEFDSVAGEGVVGSYGNIEELFVENPRAILPCFLVIYRAMD